MHEILNSSYRLFKELRDELKQHFDLQSAIDNHAATEVTFDYVEKNCLDGEFSYVCVLDGIKPLYVLGRLPEYEMEDDEEFATHVRFSDTDITLKKCVNYCRKNAAKLRFVVIDLFKVKSHKKKSYIPYDMQWHHELNLENRKKQALYCKLYKYFISGTNYSDIRPERLHKEIERFIFTFAKLLQPIKSLVLTRFEYEKEERFIFLDCNVEFTLANGKVSKYNSLSIGVRQESELWPAIYRQIPMTLQSVALQDYITHNCFVNFNSEYVVKDCETLYNRLISKHNA